MRWFLLWFSGNMSFSLEVADKLVPTATMRKLSQHIIVATDICNKGKPETTQIQLDLVILIPNQL